MILKYMKKINQTLRLKAGFFYEMYFYEMMHTHYVNTGNAEYILNIKLIAKPPSSPTHLLKYTWD